MILADSSVWIDHLRAGESHLSALLDDGRVAIHPFATAEIALGSRHARRRVLGLLDGLPCAAVASVDEIRLLIEDERLHGRGVGFVDVSLLAACRLAPDLRLWTRDRRLRAAAEALDLAAREAGSGA